MSKAQSQYISWILIVGLIVAISYFLYSWSIQQAEIASSNIESSADPLICSAIGISVDGICQNYNSLEINVTNVNELKLEGFIIHTIGLYPETDNYLDSDTVFYEIEPQDSERLLILKSGTIGQVELVPFTTKNKKYIYCDEQAIIKENIVQC